MLKIANLDMLNRPRVQKVRAKHLLITCGHFNLDSSSSSGSSSKWSIIGSGEAVGGINVFSVGSGCSVGCLEWDLDL